MGTGICAYLQNQGFDVSWVVNRLNYIEHLCFSQPLIPELHGIDCCIEGAKTEVQHLQAHVDDAKSNIQDLPARAKIDVQDLQAPLQQIQHHTTVFARCLRPRKTVVYRDAV